MGVRRARFGEAVVAVVEDHDEPQAVDRGESGTPGADDDIGRSPQHPQPPAIAGRRTETGRQGDHPVSQCGTTGRLDPVEIALVGDDHDHPVAAPDGVRGQFGDPGRPVLPGSACQAARPGPPAPMSSVNAAAPR